MNAQGRRLAAAVVIAIAPIGLAVTWLWVRSDLPGRLATHFGLDGTPDGFQSAGVLMAWLLPLTAVTAFVGILAILRLRAPGVRVLAGVLGYVSWLFAAVGVELLLAARGVADPRDVRSGAGDVLLLIVLSAAVGVLVWRLTPPGPRRPDRAAPAASIPVAPGERVVWLGRATSPAAGRVAGVLMLTGAVLLAAAWLTSAAYSGLLIAGTAVLVAALATGWCRSVDVRVDNDGVVATLGGLPWPRLTTPIERIEGARVEQIEPVRWGGWGWRLGPRGSAIVIRSGPGMVLQRHGRGDLAITVDDADTAAGLVNGLIAARR